MERILGNAHLYRRKDSLEREGVFGEEDRALGGCRITRSKGAEVKKAGLGMGGGRGPVQ